MHTHGETNLLDCDTKVGAWTSAEKAAFKGALDLYSEVTGLHFREVGSATKANLTWSQSHDLARKDTLLGGGGADRFLLQHANASGLDFIGARKFDGEGGEVRYIHHGGNALVQVDTDSDGTADMQIVLHCNLDLVKRDFML